PVRTVKAEVGRIEVEREFGGGLVGSSQADLYIRISEAVSALPFKIGDKVKAGSVVVLLDKGGASSQYFQAKSTFENAEKNFNKMKYLFEEKAISETQFDQAENAYQVARANFESARELVEISSPINGTLVELNVLVGDIPPVGKIAARVAQIDSLRMSFGVPSNLAEKFRVGMVGTLQVALDDSSYACTITRVASAADPQTRTFTVEVSVPNFDQRLQPGAFAKAKFVVESSESALKVPQSSLVSEEGVYSLYVVKNDTAYARTVDVGLKNEQNVEVLSGIEAGDEVVYLGQGFLSNGNPIVRSEN
ncbi:MAG: efflux RND transporter periplasmic adaptor subunit, partial [Candidatus Zixiibacteriota bacterium]